MGARRGNVLKSYELTNLLFFLIIILGLGVFVAWVFRSYSNPDGQARRVSPENAGIQSEVFSPFSDSCIFYVGTKLTDAQWRCRSPLEIPVADDGFVAELFAIPGVVEVVVDQTLVVIQKSSTVNWEAILPQARTVINKHLHMHR